MGTKLGELISFARFAEIGGDLIEIRPHLFVLRDNFLVAPFRFKYCVVICVQFIHLWMLGVGMKVFGLFLSEQVTYFTVKHAHGCFLGIQLRPRRSLMTFYKILLNFFVAHDLSQTREMVAGPLVTLVGIAIL